MMEHYTNSPLHSVVLPFSPHHLNSLYYYTSKLEFYHMGMGLSYGIDSQASALDNSISSVKCNAQTARQCNTCPLYTTLNMAQDI